MSRIGHLLQIDDREDTLVAHFAGHPVLACLERLSRAELLPILIQRRFLSLAFTPFYDVAIDGLGDETSRAAVRAILREEYGSGAQPTHREDLVQDLLALGATREQVLGSAPSSTTLAVLGRMFAALRKDENEELYQIKILTTLRMAGEILVAVEYERYWPQLQRLGLRTSDGPEGTRSVFYYPHMCHDERRQRLGEERNPLVPMTHSDRLTERLQSRLRDASPEAIAYSIQAAEVAQDIKRSFYDQFPS